MNRISKIITSLFAVCVSLAVLAIGVFAAQTVTYNWGSTVTFIADGIYLYANGSIWQGDNESMQQSLTGPEGSVYTYSDTNYETESEHSLVPKGGVSAAAFEPWNIGEIVFDQVKNIIEIRVEFTNYSEFDVMIVVENKTEAHSSIEMTEDVSGLNKIAPRGVASYILRLDMFDYAEKIDWDIDIDVTAYNYNNLPEGLNSLEFQADSNYEGTDVLGGGKYVIGQKLSLEAEQQDGKTFIGWIDNASGQFVSLDSKYQTTVTETTSLDYTAVCSPSTALSLSLSPTISKEHVYFAHHCIPRT